MEKMVYYVGNQSVLDVNFKGDVIGLYVYNVKADKVIYKGKPITLSLKVIGETYLPLNLMVKEEPTDITDITEGL